MEQALGISGVITNVYSWTTPQSAEEKAQKDLIIKRTCKVINVCEMKFYDGEYSMKKKDYEDIERRVRAFRAANNVRMARPRPSGSSRGDFNMMIPFRVYSDKNN